MGAEERGTRGQTLGLLLIGAGLAGTLLGKATFAALFALLPQSAFAAHVGLYMADTLFAVLTTSAILVGCVCFLGSPVSRAATILAIVGFSVVQGAHAFRLLLTLGVPDTAGQWQLWGHRVGAMASVVALVALGSILRQLSWSRGALRDPLLYGVSAVAAFIHFEPAFRGEPLAVGVPAVIYILSATASFGLLAVVVRELLRHGEQRRRRTVQSALRLIALGCVGPALWLLVSTGTVATATVCGLAISTELMAAGARVAAAASGIIALIGLASIRAAHLSEESRRATVVATSLTITAVALELFQLTELAGGASTAVAPGLVQLVRQGMSLLALLALARVLRTVDATVDHRHTEAASLYVPPSILLVLVTLLAAAGTVLTPATAYALIVSGAALLFLSHVRVAVAAFALSTSVKTDEVPPSARLVVR